MQLRVAGWRPLSLIDYPGKMAAVIFIAGCNLRCHYCHNYQILSSSANQIDLQDIIAQLQQRRDWLDAVVVSGGEPTVSPVLIPILRALRAVGLLIKLDTNGMRPDVVRQVVNAGLIDFVALDLKAPPAKHQLITGAPIDKMLQTLAYLRLQSHVPYLLRTTVSPLLTLDDLILMGKTMVNGADCWQIQQCRVVGAYSDAEICRMSKFLEKYALHVVVSGI